MEDVFKIKTVNHTYGEVYVNAELDRESVDRYLLKVRWLKNVPSHTSGSLAHTFITANILFNVNVKH